MLAQHAVTCALGGGFIADDLFDEVRSTEAYSDLTEEEWAWVLDFVVRGGEPLRAYPDFRRVERADDGRYVVTDKKMAHRHRLSVGTIVADAAVQVRFLKGPRLGHGRGGVRRPAQGRGPVPVRRAVAGVRPPARQTAWVKQVQEASRRPCPAGPAGGCRCRANSPTPSGDQLDRAGRGEFGSPEMIAARPILQTQARRSHVPGRPTFSSSACPTATAITCSSTRSRAGSSTKDWPPCWRTGSPAGGRSPLSLAVNDYGLELLCHEPLDFTETNSAELLAPENLASDILASLNTAELARRQFREVARVAGLVFPGLPHAGKTAKQLQASATLFYNVFCEYDPDNLLLRQARKEVLERQFEQSRMVEALARLRDSRFVIVELDRPTPMGFPLLVDRIRESLSRRSWPTA